MEEELQIRARRIRAFRKLKGYTQKQLADELHVSVSVIGAIERGVRKPSIQMVQDIARQLDIHVDELEGKRERSETE